MSDLPFSAGSKRAQRAIRWEFNRRLLAVSLALAALLALSFWMLNAWQSRRIAQSFIATAQQAEAEQNWGDQIKWLQRYRLLVPDDKDGLIRLAVASDNLASQKNAAVNQIDQARALLRDAVASFAKVEIPLDQQIDLRRRYIARLSQFGGRWADEAITQILTLKAKENDPEILRALALSLQARQSRSERPQPETTKTPPVDRNADFWLWLSQQPQGLVLHQAWQANQQDLNLAALLLDACLRQPEQFSPVRAKDQPPAAESLPDPSKSQSIAAELAKYLDSMPDSGHAQWLLYRFEAASTPGIAGLRLEQAAAPALVRLTSAAKLATVPESTERSSPTSDPQEGPRSPSPPADYNPQWDFELVLQSAQALATKPEDKEGVQKAIARLEQLRQLPDLKLPPSLIEPVYLLQGRLQWDATAYEPAWQVWQAGIERLGSDAIQLQMANASALSERGDLAQAKLAVEQMEKDLQSRTLDLASARGANLSAAQRLTMQASLDEANWTLRLLKGQIALRSERPRQAIELLQTSLNSQLPISNQNRTRAAALLGEAYTRTALWDMAALVYERAVAISPDQVQYRALAAEAWSKAGDFERSFKQWQAIDAQTVPLALARLRVLINKQQYLPPSSRDFSEAMTALKKIRQSLTQIPPQFQAEKDQWQLQADLLALALPEDEKGANPKPSLERLADLATQHPENSELQALAVLSLAAAKDIPEAKKALNRLRESAKENSFLYQQTLARLAITQGDTPRAITSLTQHATNQPVDAREALSLAADFAQANHDPDLALQCLLKVPQAQHTPELLFRIFTLTLAGSSPESASETSGETQTQRAAKWEQTLVDLEGNSGTWWRLARATRLLTDLEKFPPHAPERQAHLSEAEGLRVAIQRIRPNWSYGHSLAGHLAALRGDSKRAIEALRLGVDSGDQRISTTMLLVSQLTSANRIPEAEAEFSRIARLTESHSLATSLALAIAEKKGDMREVLSVAKEGTQHRPHDTSAWLVLGQAAAVAARATEDAEVKKSLLAEAQQALDQALLKSNQNNLAVYQARVRFQAAFFSTEQVRKELKSAAESKVPEPQRSLFVGLAYLELQSPSDALPLFQRALRAAPRDADVYLAMSDYYRLTRDEKEAIKMLEQAFQVAPQRVDVRSRLALAIAVRDGVDVPWQRLSQLLENDLTRSSPNKLLHALILMNRGDTAKQDQAAQILRDLIRQRDPGADDATRMLAALERRRWSVAMEDPKSETAARALAEARQLYSTLVQRPDPLPMDLYRYADLLLRAKQTQLVPALADQLDSSTNGAALALDIRLRLARQTGDDAQATELVRTWAQRAIESNGMQEISAWETAGRTLSNLGMHEQALDWLEKAFQEDDSHLQAYVVALARGKYFDRAVDVCLGHFKKTQKPEVVALLADVVIVSGKSNDVPPDLEKLFVDSVQQFKANPSLVESIATLRLSQQRHEEAALLYEHAEQLAPQSVRLLNNLAMALSEISGRAADAIPKIQKAIDLHGRSPELLDTQGLVLLRNNRREDAVNVLREAVANSEDPRYRFHLLMALAMRSDKSEAQLQWAQLDLQKLRQTVLTPAERRDLETLEQQFSARRTPPSP